MRGPPGVETLWSGHSGHFCWTRRLASSTRSWKRRSSRFGTGSAILILLQDCCVRSCRLRGDHVEGEDQVARVIGLADGIADFGISRARVRAVEARDHVAALAPPV